MSAASLVWALCCAVPAPLVHAQTEPAMPMPPGSLPSGYGLGGFHYYGAPVSSLITTGNAKPRGKTPAQQHVLDLYEAEDYAAAGDQGLALLPLENVDDNLRLLIGNSLAWTGRLDEAMSTYQSIQDPAVVPDANVGIANILRWKNTEHLSVPIYQGVLRADPRNTDARNGLLLAQRELAPRTTVSLGGMGDSNGWSRNDLEVNHRWRTDDGYGKFDVTLHGYHDTSPDINDPGSVVDTTQQEATLRYQALDREYKPTFELGVPEGGGAHTPHGGLKLLFLQDHVQLDVGFVNWGMLANNANALAQGLNASHVGLSAQGPTKLGEITGHLDYFGVTDSNTVVDAGTRLTSNWQPLGNHIKLYTGLDFRQSSFNTLSYWSPNTGYGFLYVGMQADWAADDWEIYTQGHVGTGVYGESANGWSFSTGARRWVSRDVALGINFWDYASLRYGDPYYYRSLNVVLEKVWR